MPSSECPWLPTWPITPYFRAAARMSFTSATVSAIGFSTYTCRPFRIASSAAGAWWWLGVAIATASSEPPSFSSISR